MTRFVLTGTVEEAIAIEETSLNRKLPNSFRVWLLKNNGQDIRGVFVYPIRDERDTRKTWNSLANNLKNEWAEATRDFEQTGADYSHLLPFADFNVRDYFCFDYSVVESDGEHPVVVWLHETGEVRFFANNFSEFEKKILADTD